MDDGPFSIVFPDIVPIYVPIGDADNWLAVFLPEFHTPHDEFAVRTPSPPVPARSPLCSSTGPTAKEHDSFHHTGWTGFAHRVGNGEVTS